MKISVLIIDCDAPDNDGYYVMTGCELSGGTGNFLVTDSKGRKIPVSDDVVGEKKIVTEHLRDIFGETTYYLTLRMVNKPEKGGKFTATGININEFQ